jgi:hypothetical protein
VKTLVSPLLWFGFVMSILGAVSVSHLIDDSTQQLMATLAMLVISLVSGTLLARREPVKSFLASRPVQWFLFLVNLAGGVLALLLVDGAQGLGAGIGLLAVSLGSGAGLVLRRRAA